jgi:alanine racemase
LAFPIAEIDLSALTHNLQQVKRRAPDAQVIAVIKANGYGHGMFEITSALAAADGFAVARLDEAITLRKSGIDKKILLLEGVESIEDWHLCAQYHFDCVIHHVSQIEQITGCLLSQPLAIWLKVDTGMHRLGLPLDQVDQCIKQLQSSNNVSVDYLMSHFANADVPADEYNRQQEFNFSTIKFDGKRSMANSAAILSRQASHHQCVRPGIMLYGSCPIENESAQDYNLQPVMIFKTELISLSVYKKGEPIGYGGQWRCPEDMLIGVAAVGYGDGYPRHAENGTPVLLNGKLASLAGRVSMDMITIDLRRVPDAKIGDEVVLWGRGVSVDVVARHAGTISYELLCSITSRVKKIYKQ